VRGAQSRREAIAAEVSPRGEKHENGEFSPAQRGHRSSVGVRPEDLGLGAQRAEQWCDAIGDLEVLVAEVLARRSADDQRRALAAGPQERDRQLTGDAVLSHDLRDVGRP
jgi:hypothetical protein